jgi:hypothetical protein
VPTSQTTRSFGQILAIEVTDGGMYVADGQPVWPVRNGQERLALEHMVTSLGGRVEFTNSASKQTLTGPELVVGLGSGAFEDARLYAHLTGRQCLCVETRDELGSLQNPSVVVTTVEHVNEQLFDLLYDRGSMDVAPGVIFSFDDSGLRCQVLARAATLRCAPRELEWRRIDLYPLLEFGYTASSDFTALGAKATREDFREAMSAGAGVLTLSTHSDGIDAQLLPNLVLCPMDRVPDTWDRQIGPSCLLTGVCHRRDRPVSQALEEGSLLSPADVVADVFVHCVCWGLYPAPGVQSPVWSLARRVLESFKVGALITTWEIVGQSVITTANLFHNIACGMPLGHALALHLSSEEAIKRGHRLCLVGDPAMRLSECELADPLQDVIEASIEPESPSEEHLAGLALLRLMVMQARRVQKDGRSDTSQEALAAAANYEEALLTGAPLEGGDGSPGPLLRLSMVEYFSNRHTDASKYWIPYAGDVRALSEKGTCPACGRRTVSRVYRMRIPDAPPRRHTHCPTCGPIEDVPIHRHLTIAVESRGVILLGGDLPDSDWYAQVVLETQVAELQKKWEWPADSDGTPIRAFRPPEDWPAVPLRVAVLLIRSGCEFNVVGCLCRVMAETGGPSDHS